MACARSGHTLLELSVVVSLLALCGVAAMHATAPVQRIQAGFHARSSAALELQAAREWLRQDLGAAQTLTRRSDGSLLIVRELAATIPLVNHPGASDPGVTYALTAGSLVREDLLLRERTVVAAGIGSFAVLQARGGETRIRLAAAPSSTTSVQHAFTLAWTRS